MNMRILHVVPSFHPATAYGGPVASTFELTRALSRRGHEVRVLTTDGDGRDRILAVPTGRDVAGVDGIRIRYHHRVASHAVAPGLLRELPGAVHWADVVHLTAVYSFPTIPTLATARRAKKPVMWSTRGALQRWPGTRRRAAKSWWEATCKLVLPRNLAFHATSDDEANSNAARFAGVPNFVIANGVEVPAELTRPSFDGDLHALWIGRIDPIKGLEALLRAWAELPTGWQLTLAGTGPEAYVARLRTQASELGLGERVRFAGHVEGAAKEGAFRAADLVVLPSHRENFGMAVVEALARGVPVLAAKGTPWARLEAMGCGLWVDNSPAALADALLRAAKMPLREMGSRGRSWMKAEFSWDGVAHRMIDAYARLEEHR